MASPNPVPRNDTPGIEQSRKRFSRWRFAWTLKETNSPRHVNEELYREYDDDFRDSHHIGLHDYRTRGV